MESSITQSDFPLPSGSKFLEGEGPRHDDPWLSARCWTMWLKWASKNCRVWRRKSSACETVISAMSLGPALVFDETWGIEAPPPGGEAAWGSTPARAMGGPVVLSGWDRWKVKCLGTTTSGSQNHTTLWLCQNSYWKWPFIVDFPIENGGFP